MRKKIRSFLRRVVAAALAAVTLWAVVVTADAASPDEAARSIEENGAWAVRFLRWELADFSHADTLSALTVLALGEAPLLLSQRDAVALAQAQEKKTQTVQVQAEEQEGSILVEPEASAPPVREEPLTVRDNGVSARTLRPADDGEYTVTGGVYIKNSTAYTLSASLFEEPFDAQLIPDGPQVLIIHTHATEAYTMPAGEEYEQSDAFRTTDVRYNMVRVGDEIASGLAARGISVLHDRTLYDYPAYNGAYSRSAESIKRYLAEYPTIRFVLDVHRDAIEDTQGNTYKAVCGEDANLAQLEFVMGSDGGGASHENWRENLKLAAAVQQTAVEKLPTLMRPIILRAARYNQQLSTGSLLVEVGAAGNSLEEALLSAQVFAECFADTVQKG